MGVSPLFSNPSRLQVDVSHRESFLRLPFCTMPCPAEMEASFKAGARIWRAGAGRRYVGALDWTGLELQLDVSDVPATHIGRRPSKTTF